MPVPIRWYDHQRNVMQLAEAVMGAAVMRPTDLVNSVFGGAGSLPAAVQPGIGVPARRICRTAGHVEVLLRRGHAVRAPADAGLGAERVGLPVLASLDGSATRRSLRAPGLVPRRGMVLHQRHHDQRRCGSGQRTLPRPAVRSPRHSHPQLHLRPDGRLRRIVLGKAYFATTEAAKTALPPIHAALTDPPGASRSHRPESLDTEPTPTGGEASVCHCAHVAPRRAPQPAGAAPATGRAHVARAEVAQLARHAPMRPPTARKTPHRAASERLRACRGPSRLSGQRDRYLVATCSADAGPRATTAYWRIEQSIRPMSNDAPNATRAPCSASTCLVDAIAEAHLTIVLQRPGRPHARRQHRRGSGRLRCWASATKRSADSAAARRPSRSAVARTRDPQAPGVQPRRARTLLATLHSKAPKTLGTHLALTSAKRNSRVAGLGLGRQYCAAASRPAASGPGRDPRSPRSRTRR